MRYDSELLRRRRAEIAAGTADVPHGSQSTYRNWGCRCDECRAANVDTNRVARERRKAALEQGKVVRPHGVYSTYANYSCRCDACCESNRERKRRLGESKRSPAGPS